MHLRGFTFLFLISASLATNKIYAQESGIPIKSVVINDSLKKIKISDSSIHYTPQKDLGDLARKVFRLKPSADKKDSSIVKPVYSVVVALGYTLTTKLALTLSGNCAFRTGKISKLSTLTASAAYTQNRQFTVPFVSNIWSPQNLYNFQGDFRFYKYPQSTYGLGTNSSKANENRMYYDYFRLSEIVLRKVSGELYAGGGFIVDDHRNIADDGHQDKSVSDYEVYGRESHTVSAGITLNTLYDTRDNGINPTKGFYSGVQYRNNLTSFSSTRNWQSVLIDLRKYFIMPGGSRNVLAFWSYNWLVIQGKPPYLDLPSTAWDAFYNTGQGYIQGRFRGAQMVYAETQYRFAITRNGLLGGVLFVNAQCFSAAPGSNLESIQPGIGPGLRIKLNKVSGTNIAIDYGFGTNGSRGLFINIGEAF